jgi:hypothetical protein
MSDTTTRGAGTAQGSPRAGGDGPAPSRRQVELDAETGEVRILRYLVAEDCGTVLNRKRCLMAGGVETRLAADRRVFPPAGRR